MITNSVFDVILVSVGHVHQPVEFEVRPSLGFRFAACPLWWPSFRCHASDAGVPTLTLKHDFVWCYWFFLSVLNFNWLTSCAAMQVIFFRFCGESLSIFSTRSSGKRRQRPTAFGEAIFSWKNWLQFFLNCVRQIESKTWNYTCFRNLS